MCKVEEIMTRKVLTIAAEADVKDAAWGLTLQGFTGAPVKDEHGNVIGVLSKSDLTDPSRVDPDSTAPHTVREAMTPVLFATLATDPVKFAVRRMVETGSHRLLVLDADGKLVGILTPMDVMRGLLDHRIAPGHFD
jgi:CBS-domain-containing membrane protein